MNKKRITYVFIASLVCAITVGAGVGWYIGYRQKQNPSSSSIGLVTVRENSPLYKFTNPLLFNDTSKDLFTQEFVPLNKTINGFIADKKEVGEAGSVSMYFRYLNSGHWTGINEDETYEPSSMLKVLVMMSAVKLAVADPDFLLKQLQYNGPDDAGQYYKPNDGIAAGYYPVERLIGYMITYSDNGATLALLSDPQINQEFQDLNKTFRLPVRASASGPVPDFMSAKSYSVLFRSLYNGAILSADLCEKILSVLASTTFNNGLVAGVPAGTVVAHKFGENTNYDTTSGSLINHELHDCGIVYYPNHPYLLCVMTKGNGFPSLEGVVSGISKIVYTYVASSFPAKTVQ